MIFVLSPTSRVRPRGSGFKFFNELLDEGLIGGAVMAEGTDVLLTATGVYVGTARRGWQSTEKLKT